MPSARSRAGPGGRLVLAAALGAAGAGDAWSGAVAWSGGGAVGAATWPRCDAAGPVLRAFRRLETAMDAHRHPLTAGRDPGGVRVPAAARRPAAVAVLERECYGPRPPAEPEAAAAVATFERLTAELESADRR